MNVNKFTPVNEKVLNINWWGIYLVAHIAMGFSLHAVKFSVSS